jgi:hypothetical protein
VEEEEVGEPVTAPLLEVVRPEVVQLALEVVAGAVDVRV